MDIELIEPDTDEFGELTPEQMAILQGIQSIYEPARRGLTDVSQPDAMKEM